LRCQTPPAKNCPFATRGPHSEQPYRRFLSVRYRTPVSCWAGYDEGVQAHARGDYATALREWRPLANQGYAAAQNNLGVMYDQGQGVPQDYAQALHWYRQAAKQGHAGAQYNLGVLYHHGRGVPQDYAQAIQWYRKAAEQGDADAQYNLGVLYQEGGGVPQDYAQAIQWYRKRLFEKFRLP
jgi:uncharacterized protein